MFCAQCGNELATGSKFCGGCGFQISSTSPEIAPTPEPVLDKNEALIKVARGVAWGEMGRGIGWIVLGLFITGIRSWVFLCLQPCQGTCRHCFTSTVSGFQELFIT